nr:energy-coupling factor ABC transporter ATP-binding protein [Bifidobacterium dolichotidis]
MSMFSSMLHRRERNSVTDVTIHLDQAALRFPNGNVGLQPTTVTFEPAARHTALIGLNGAGKSTLLDLIAGKMQPTEGSVQVTAQDKKWTTSSKRQRNEIAQILPLVRAEQVPASFEHADSIQDALEHELKRLHVPTTEMLATIQQVFSLFDLTHLARMRVAALDAEQLHMLTLAYACAMNPAVLVADEPTRGLDEISSAHVAQALFHCGKPVIFATHDIDLVRNADYLIDRVLVLDDQRIVFDGDPATACEHYSDVIRSKYAKVMHGLS